MEDSVRQAAAEFLLQRGWKRKIGKQKGFNQSLFEHTLMQLDLINRLGPILCLPNHFALTELEVRILQAAVIAHDVGKETSEWQDYIAGRGEWVSHTVPAYTKQHLPEFMDALGFGNLATDDVLAIVENCINLHMKYARNPGSLFASVLGAKDSAATDRWWTVARIVDAADNVCSADGLWNGVAAFEKSVFRDHLHLSYHLVNIRGVSTPLLHQAALESFMEHGWTPLLHYPDATIYCASRSSEMAQPSRATIAQRLTDLVTEAYGSNLDDLMVGSPTGTILPKPELFEHAESRRYLEKASRKISRQSFAKKAPRDRLPRIMSYLKLKGQPEADAEKRLQELSERISNGQPEMLVFKFFKAMMNEAMVGEKGAALAREAYERAFGDGTWKLLQTTSTLMPAKDMALTVDAFWSLPGVERLNPSDRTNRLIDTLHEIARSVYAGIEQPPSRHSLAESMAAGFMADLVKPEPEGDVRAVAEADLRAYSASKPFAGRNAKKGEFFCQICSSPFTSGAEALADFVPKPESHTNRGISHGPFNAIMICNTCRHERILRQILLGQQPAEMIVLYPRMNISADAGGILVDRVRRIYNSAVGVMEAQDGDIGRNLSFSLTGLIAGNVSGKGVFGLSPEEVVELLTYRSADEKRKVRQREAEKPLRELYDDDIQSLNGDWGTNVSTWEEAIDVLVTHPPAAAADVRAQVLKRTAQFRAVCRTPHMILLPLALPIAMKKDSDTNAGLRKLFISLLIALSLDVAVAIVADDAALPVVQDGIAYIPPVPSIRDLIERVRLSPALRQSSATARSDWLGIEEGETWLNAIGAAARLTGSAQYPESSNLYDILTAPTPGHILRRIEMKSEGANAQPYHFALIERIKEVLA
jgi:hypothetical protein